MGLFRSILNLFFPPRCVSCKQEGDFLCKNCVQELKIHPLKAKSVCPSSEDFEYLDGVIYGADYAKNPQIQAAIMQFKYKFTRELVSQFGTLVSDKMKEMGMLRIRPAVLIPVPLHKKRLNYRGFNQAELIAHETLQQYGGKAEVLSLLSRVKNTSQQAKLNKKERIENLAGAFEVTGDLTLLNGKICFVVDDVCTTGSTLDNCAKVLKRCGVKKVYGLVVARAFK
jgi:competence protein ComFC